MDGYSLKHACIIRNFKKLAPNEILIGVKGSLQPRAHACMGLALFAVQRDPKEVDALEAPGTCLRRRCDADFALSSHRSRLIQV